VTSTTRLSTTKYNPWLSPPAISVIATTSEEDENHHDNQNGCHSFLQNMHQGISLLYIWVRNNYLTSLGIYLFPVASGWFLAIDRAAHRDERSKPISKSGSGYILRNDVDESLISFQKVSEKRSLKSFDIGPMINDLAERLKQRKI